MEGATSSFTFKGSIPDAIVASQREKKLFLVYVSDENDPVSVQMEQSTWIIPKVAESMMKNCVFLHLLEGSVDAQNFSAIYSQKGVPCITAVSHGGMLMWQKEGYVTADELVATIEDVTSRLQPKTVDTVLQAAVAAKQPECSNSASQDTSAEKCITPDVVNEVPTSLYEESSKQNLDTREMECNLHGAFSSDDGPVLKPLSAELTKDLTGEITIEETFNTEPHGTSHLTNQENTTFYSPLEEEIVQDIGQQSLHEIEQDNLSSRSEEKDVFSEAEISTDIHLHIRFPGGSSLHRVFCATDTLKAVKSFVDENLSRSVGRYDLATPYPKRIFNSEDMSKSLIELGLIKRDSLIVIPHKSSARSYEQRSSQIERPKFIGDAGSSTNGWIFGWVFGFVRRILAFVNPFSYLGGRARLPSSDSNQEYRPNSAVQSPPSGTRTSPSSSSTGQKVGPKTTGPGSNIHTLQRDKDDSPFNDRNSFWNGNSTQYGGDDKK